MVQENKRIARHEMKPEELKPKIFRRENSLRWVKSSSIEGMPFELQQLWVEVDSGEIQWQLIEIIDRNDI